MTNKYIEKIASTLDNLEENEKRASVLGALAVGHVAQNAATMLRIKSPGFWQRAGDSFSRGMAGLPEGEAGLKNKAKGALAGVLYPEEGILAHKAHKLGQTITGGAIPEGGATFAQKREIAKLRMAGRGEFSKLQRRGHLGSPAITTAAEQVNPALAKRLATATPEDARIAENIYQRHYNHPLIKEIERQAITRRDISSTAGKAGSNFMKPQLAGAATASVGEAAITGSAASLAGGVGGLSSLKMGLASDTAGKIAPIRKVRDKAIELLYANPIKKGIAMGEAGKEIPMKEYLTRSLLANPVAADMQNMSNMMAHQYRNEIGQARHNINVARGLPHQQRNKALQDWSQGHGASSRSRMEQNLAARGKPAQPASAEAAPAKTNPIQQVVDERAIRNRQHLEESVSKMRQKRESTHKSPMIVDKSTPADAATPAQTAHKTVPQMAPHHVGPNPPAPTRMATPEPPTQGPQLAPGQEEVQQQAESGNWARKLGVGALGVGVGGAGMYYASNRKKRQEIPAS